MEVPTIYKAYVREYPHKIWPEKWYSTSILGSWNSHRSLRSQEGDLVFGTVPWMPWMPWIMAGEVPPICRMENPEFISHEVVKCT